MKLKNIITVILLLITTITVKSQTNINIGAGYYGESLTYPGIVGEIEYEKFHTNKFSTPLKLNIGFYNHPRSHNALFVDLHEGFRRYSKNSRWYYEQSVGFGIMLSFYNEDVWHIDENDRAAYVSNTANLDYLPSITFGGGFNLTPEKESSNYIWIRPKVSWQFPFNTLALPHIAVQFGYSLTLKTK